MVGWLAKARETVETFTSQVRAISRRVGLLLTVPNYAILLILATLFRVALSCWSGLTEEQLLEKKISDEENWGLIN